jgi:hypothetical protein
LLGGHVTCHVLIAVVQVTGGTDNHLLLWDLRGEGISGAKMEKACDVAHITLNKNAVVGDVSAMNPGGVRIGGQHCQGEGRAEQQHSRNAGPGQWVRLKHVCHNVCHTRLTFLLDGNQVLTTWLCRHAAWHHASSC